MPYHAKLNFFYTLISAWTFLITLLSYLLRIIDDMLSFPLVSLSLHGFVFDRDLHMNSSLI